MAKVLNLYEAKSQLSSLVEEAAGGAEIVIAQARVPRARLVPLQPRARRRPGGSRGRVWVRRDFEPPLPHEGVAAFEGAAGNAPARLVHRRTAEPRPSPPPRP